MTEAYMMPVPEGEEDQPISEDAIRELHALSIAIDGHGKTLDFLSDAVDAAFRNGHSSEVERIVELMEFTTLELQEAANKAEDLVQGWGNCQRRAKKHGAKPETESPGG